MSKLHHRTVVFSLGNLLLIVAVAMLLPLPWAFVPGAESWRALLLSVFPTALAGLGLRRMGRNGGELRRRDTYLLVVLAWLAAALVGSLPYLWSGVLPAFTDAVFESMSGFTTTGASVLTNLEAVPPGILFWRSMTHWLGGMGIMVLLVALLSALGVGGLQVMRAEAPGPSLERVSTRVRETARALWLTYVALTGLQTLLLWALGMSLFDALNHAFSTMATGGFSTRNASLGAYSPALQWVTTLFMFLAGVNFALFVSALNARSGKPFWRDPEFRLYLGVTLLAMFGLTVLVGNEGLSWGEAFRHGSFQALSILTTTGFATYDYTQWTVGAQAVLGMLSVIGACAGSTGGGVKIIRYLVLMRHSATEFARQIQPRTVRQVRLGSRVVPDEMVMHIQQFFFLYVVALGLGFLLFAASGMDLVSSLSAAAVTLGNVGPGLGEIGPVNNYAELKTMAKWTATVLMLLGRLELYTVLALFSPLFWRR